MDIKEKVGQRLMVGISGKTIDRHTKKHLLEIKPGSIILFKRNIASVKQVRTLISHLQELLPSSPLIAIDQEGGRVIRFTREITVFPGNMALGAVDSPELAHQQGVLSASQLKQMGITINLAPVVDVITSHYNPGITTRSFGDDPERVSTLAGAFIQGTQKVGVAAVAKHFPGKGAAEVDAHYDLPTIAVSRLSFEKIHLLPFQNAAENGVRGIMSSHIHCPTLDRQDHAPATFSRKIVKNHLRTTLNYQGVILSDDLEMGAIAHHYPIEEACCKATQAGHDILLICSNYQWQRRGFDALLHAYTHSLLPLAELDASIERINQLKKFCNKKTPPTRSTIPRHTETLARQIAQQSITIISDDRHLLPLDRSKVEDLLLLIPDLSLLPALEGGYEPTEHHFLIRQFKRTFPGGLSFYFFSLNPTRKEIEQMTRLACTHALSMVCISNAQGNVGQRALIKRAHTWDCDSIFVLLDNPFDREFLSPKDTCITSYGYRRVQLSSLVEVMVGKVKAMGKLPFKVR